MEKSHIKIGYCPTQRELFDPDEPVAFRCAILEKLHGFAIQNVEFIDIADCAKNGVLMQREDAQSVIACFSAAAVDAVFFPHVNFGTEFLVAEVAKALRVPVLLWGPRDEGPDPQTGARKRDSQCGLFATGKVLRRFGVPFTYLINSWLDSEDFRNGFMRFIRVANVVKAMTGLKILQISTRPQPFMSVICNESELIERFGIVVEPVTIPELVRKMREIKAAGGEEFDRTRAYIQSFSPGCRVEKLETLVSLKMAVRRIADELRCRAAAIQCWYSLPEETGVAACLSNALLADDGFPCVCETDIHGAVSAVMLQAAALGETPHFFSDVTIRHPSDDNTELLWHCGPFPYSLAKDPKHAAAGDHWNLAPDTYGCCQWEIKGGDITIARFDGDGGNYSLLIGEGVGVDGPKCQGTYVWLKVNDWPKWERKLVEGPYIHHVACIHGRYGEILAEACKYIPSLQPDPVEPSPEQLMQRWT